MTTATTIADIPLQIGSRLKLSYEQREQLKTAFNAAQAAHAVPVSGKSISVATAVKSSVEQELAMDKLTFSSLVNSKESIAIPLALRLQRVLNVELVSEKTLKEAFASYTSYLKQTHGLS